MDTLISLRRRRLLGAAGALATLGLAGCGERAATGIAAGTAGQRISGLTMGSTYTVRLAGTAVSADRLERLHADVQSALDGVDARMSLYRPDSELVRFNEQPADRAVPMSRELLQVLHGGQQVARLTGGAFDMTVAPLVMAWGFGPGVPATGPAVPAAAQVLDGRRRRGHEALMLDLSEGVATKQRAGMQLDLGGIAKGHGVDLAAQALLAAGVSHFMVEVGGEVRTAGLNAQGQPWRIGIEEPDAVPQRARLVLPLSGRALATSGDYRIYFEQGGRRYSHEIDPASGEPIAHGLASVSVVADDCQRADALATALIVMGADRGMALAQREHIAAHFIVRGADGRLADRSSDAFAALRQPNAA